jgi:hypothetical protein
MSNRFAIKNGLAQSDFDLAGFHLLNNPDAGGGGGGGGTSAIAILNLKTDSGAKGDGKQVIDGAMTSGSHTVTSASNPWAAGDVGKIIVVGGAGASGADLVTTIATFTSAGSVVLSGAAAGATVSSAIITFGSDDTAALQAAITTMSTAAAGRIVAPAGIYIFGGALQTTGIGTPGPAYNAQVTLPNVAPGIAANVLMIEGDRPAGGDYFQLLGSEPPRYGTIFFSTGSGSGTRPCFIGGPQLGANTMSALNFYLRNITLRTVTNPTISLLDLLKVGNAALEYVTLDVGRNPDELPQPTTTTSTGVYMPGQFNNCRNVMRSVYIMGFYCGAHLSEHADIDDLTIQSCYHAVELDKAYHISFIARMGMWACPYGIYVNDSCNIHIAALGIEHGSADVSPPAWFALVADIYDPGNNLKGIVCHHAEIAAAGQTFELIVNGGARVTTFAIGDDGSGNYNFGGVGTGTSNRTLSFGPRYGQPAISLYDGGAGARSGLGIQGNELQFFTTSASPSHFSWNKGGDLQASGTNELMRLDASTGALYIGTKARLVPIAGPPGGVQLQVLNSSAVWENVDSWVAST